MSARTALVAAIALLIVAVTPVKAATLDLRSTLFDQVLQMKWPENATAKSKTHESFHFFRMDAQTFRRDARTFRRDARSPCRHRHGRGPAVPEWICRSWRNSSNATVRPERQRAGHQPARPVGQRSDHQPARPVGQRSDHQPARPVGQRSDHQPARPVDHRVERVLTPTSGHSFVQKARNAPGAARS